MEKHPINSVCCLVWLYYMFAVQLSIKFCILYSVFSSLEFKHKSNNNNKK
jgi:hypothetical protein